MKKIFLLFSHRLTEEQADDAIVNLKIDEIVYLPQELQDFWSQVDPVKNQLYKLKKIWAFVEKEGNKGDYLLVQGEWGWVFHTVNHFKKVNMIPVYSTTERKVEEIHKKNGEVEKISFFKHIKYKRY
jgi:hypothetical protein